MTGQPIPRQPIPRRMDAPDAVKSAAKQISPELWHAPYVEGRGPLHFASGPYWPAMLRECARQWRRLSDAAEVVADAMDDGGES